MVSVLVEFEIVGTLGKNDTFETFLQREIKPTKQKYATHSTDYAVHIKAEVELVFENFADYVANINSRMSDYVIRKYGIKNTNSWKSMFKILSVCSNIWRY